MMPRPKKQRRGPRLNVGPKDEPTVMVVRAHQSPLNEKQWLVALECGHERWITSDGEPKAVHCHACEAGARKGDSWGWAGGQGKGGGGQGGGRSGSRPDGGGRRRGPKAPDSGGSGK